MVQSIQTLFITSKETPPLIFNTSKIEKSKNLVEQNRHLQQLKPLLKYITKTFGTKYRKITTKQYTLLLLLMIKHLE